MVTINVRLSYCAAKEQLPPVELAEIASCVPQSLSPDREQTIYLRVKRPLKNCSLTVSDRYEKNLS